MSGVDRDALHAAAEIAVTRAFPHPGGGYSLSGAGIEDVVAVAAAPYLDALAAAEARADRAEKGLRARPTLDREALLATFEQHGGVDWLATSPGELADAILAAVEVEAMGPAADQ